MTETNKTAAATAPTPPVLPACPGETTLTLISDKWKVLILRDLLSGTKRFGELKKSIGHVTQKVLTAQLRQMEESGLLTRTVREIENEACHGRCIRCGVHSQRLSQINSCEE